MGINTRRQATALPGTTNGQPFAVRTTWIQALHYPTCRALVRIPQAQRGTLVFLEVLAFCQAASGQAIEWTQAELLQQAI